MTKTFLSLAVAALLVLPATAQAGPGVDPVQQQKPTVAPVPAGSGVGHGMGAPAPAVPPSQPGPGVAAGPAPTKSTTPPVYDEDADAKTDVVVAVAKAKKEKKRVLVTLGANWCGWCRALDRTFTQDEKVAAAIAKSYVPLKVDVGRMNRNLDLTASWGVDVKKGVPLLVVLDGKGKVVKVQDTAALEAGKGHDPEKILAFLAANAGR